MINTTGADASFTAQMIKAKCAQIGQTEFTTQQCNVANEYMRAHLLGAAIGVVILAVMIMYAIAQHLEFEKKLDDL